MHLRNIFFGWILVGYLLFTQVLTVGFLFYGFGVLLDPMAATFGLTRGQTSYGLSLFTFGIGVWSPLMGGWVGRFGAKRLMLLGLASLALGLLALGYLRSPAAYYAVMGVWLSFSVSAAAGVPSQVLVVHWFRRHRGMAMSLTSAGVSLGGLLLAPMVGWLIPKVGWNNAILLPASLLVVAFLLGLRLIRNRPEEMGLFRDGDTVDYPDAMAGELTFVSIVRDRRFQIIAVSYAIALSCMTSLMVNLVPLWTDLGVSPRAATIAFALLAGVGMVGKPFFGRLADSVDAKAGAMASFGFLLAGTVVLLWHSPWNTVPFVILFGLGIGGAVPMQGAINGAIYGREQYARIAGILTPWIVCIQALFYALTGFAHDRLHSYVPIVIAFAVLYVLCLVMLARLRIGNENAAPVQAAEA